MVKISFFFIKTEFVSLPQVSSEGQIFDPENGFNELIITCLQKQFRARVFLVRFEVRLWPKIALMQIQHVILYSFENFSGSKIDTRIQSCIYLQIFTSFCTSRDIVRYKVRWQLNLGDQTIHNFFRDFKI